MLLSYYTNMRHTRGFTIVELLIVIVVIGILAAIVIVAFNGIQNRANETAVRSDLASFNKIMAVQQADTGSYPTSLSLAMGLKFTRNAYSTTSNNIYYCSNGSTYSLTVMASTGTRLTQTPAGVSTYAGAWGGGTSCTENGMLTGDFRDYAYSSSTAPYWRSWVN